MNHTVLKSILGHANVSKTLKYYVELTDDMPDEVRLLTENII